MNIVKTPKEILDELKPCHWQYNKILDLDDKIHYGFIAQDLLKSFGTEYAFVDTDEEYLKVNYNEFIGVLTSIIKNQEQRILELERKINC